MSRIRALAEWNKRSRDKRAYVVRDRFIALIDEYDLAAAILLKAPSLGFEVLLGDSAKGYDVLRAIGVVVRKSSPKNMTVQELDALKAYLRIINERISELACVLRHRTQLQRNHDGILPLPQVRDKWYEPIESSAPSQDNATAVVLATHPREGVELNGGNGI